MLPPVFSSHDACSCQRLTVPGNIGAGIDARTCPSERTRLWYKILMNWSFSAKGSYDVYRGSCGAGVVDKSVSNEGLRRGVSNLTVLTRLPDTIQQAVCNRNIRIDNAIYGGWETTGDW